jgi:mannose-6-phosphate isomerase-like protein (cupin superfamily)
MNLAERLVRYEDLQACSDKKENFTIIGPGVAENPRQHVHIKLAHGFNIGAARQPPGCLNSQHSHLTNEVFVVHSGKWAFRTGVDATDGEITLTEGDVISLPTDVFRGFENTGGETGFLYAVLGGDDPGRVLWAPQVFDLAEGFGLVLMEDGSLVDTAAGETLPEGISPMPRTSPQQIAEHRIVDSGSLNGIVIRSQDFHWSSNTALSGFEGVQEAALLGPANPVESLPAGHLDWPHGFVLRAIRIQPGAEIPAHRRREEEVMFIQQGICTVTVDGEPLGLGTGDTFTTPIDSERAIFNKGTVPCVIYITRRNNHPREAEFK